MAQPFFSMGLNTLKVPMRMHAENRARLISRLGAVLPDGGTPVILMQVALP